MILNGVIFGSGPLWCICILLFFEKAEDANKSGREEETHFKTSVLKLHVITQNCLWCLHVLLSPQLTAEEYRWRQLHSWPFCCWQSRFSACSTAAVNFHVISKQYWVLCRELCWCYEEIKVFLKISFIAFLSLGFLREHIKKQPTLLLIELAFPRPFEPLPCKNKKQHSSTLQFFNPALGSVLQWFGCGLCRLFPPPSPTLSRVRKRRLGFCCGCDDNGKEWTWNCLLRGPHIKYKCPCIKDGNGELCFWIG